MINHKGRRKKQRRRRRKINIHIDTHEHAMLKKDEVSMFEDYESEWRVEAKDERDGLHPA